MNRRGFLKSLLMTAVASAAAPHIFIPKLIEVPRRKVIEPCLLIPAEADLGAFIHADMMGPIIDILRDRMILERLDKRILAGLI